MSRANEDKRTSAVSTTPDLHAWECSYCYALLPNVSVFHRCPDPDNVIERGVDLNEIENFIETLKQSRLKGQTVIIHSA